MQFIGFKVTNLLHTLIILSALIDEIFILNCINSLPTFALETDHVGNEVAVR